MKENDDSNKNLLVEFVNKALNDSTSKAYDTLISQLNISILVLVDHDGIMLYHKDVH